MKITVSCCGLVLLMVGFAIAQQQKTESDACGFAVQGEPAQPLIAGPDDIVPLVYVVAQPDSPIEIVAVDLQGASLWFAYETYTLKNCVKYTVHNRTDRVVRGFDLELLASGGDGGTSDRAHSSSRLAPGQTAEIGSCVGNFGHGPAPRNHVRLVVSVQSVEIGECFYRASLRIPRSLGVVPKW